MLSFWKFTNFDSFSFKSKFCLFEHRLFLQKLGWEYENSCSISPDNALHVLQLNTPVSSSGLTEDTLVILPFIAVIWFRFEVAMLLIGRIRNGLVNVYVSRFAVLFIIERHRGSEYSSKDVRSISEGWEEVERKFESDLCC